MTNLTIALLVASLAFGANTWGQNSIKDSRQLPTIEDRIGQLEQKEDDLSAQVDALNEKVTSLQQEIKFLEQKRGESSGDISQTPARSSDATADSSSDGTNGTQGASYDVFYDRLQGDGQWFNDETYGYVWQPNTASTDQKWRPYTDGRWVYTDRGWTWVSNEKFGWATYHYGRWARLSDRGWVWVPGDKWAPAWVSWRESDDYVGWAPLPPEADSDQDVKIEGWADNYYNIGPTAYVFVRTTDLGNQNYRDFIASPRDNLDFISRTKNVTNIYDGRDGVVDNGPIYDQLIQRSKVKIDRYQLRYVQQNSTQSQFGATVRGDQLEVLAPSPRLQRAATVEPKIAGNITDAQVERGWQNVDAATAQQLKQTWEKQTPVPATLPQTPRLPKPVVARTRQGEKSAGGNSEQMQQPTRSQTTESTAPTPSQNEETARSGQQPAVTNEDRRQEQNQGQRAETTPPAPTPNQKATQPGQQPIVGSENREEQNRGQRAETTPPAPTPKQKATQSGRQPIAEGENQRQDLNQEQRAETTPPAPTTSPSQNRRAVQRSERESTSEKQRQGSEDLEKTQATRKRSESVESENNQPAQSQEKPARSGNVEQGSTNAARGADEKHSDKVPPKENNATRQRANKELSPDQEGPRRDGEQSPRKSNSNEPVRELNEEKKGQGRGQSGDATPKRHLDEIEKKNVEPAVPQ